VIITALTVLFLLSFIIILAVQRLGSPAPKSGSQPVTPWIDLKVSKELSPEVLPLKARQLSPLGKPQTILDPELIEVSPWDWERIPGKRPIETHQSPSASQLRELKRDLISTECSFVLRSPAWPVCCEQLGVLIHSQGHGISLAQLESECGPLDQAFLENELKTWGGPGADLQTYFNQGWSEILTQIREGTHSGQGLNFYRCQACHRVYISSCSP